MSEQIANLSTELAGALKYQNIEIPNYIKENLSKELRDYQKRALQHYLMQRKSPQTNHLMFNMATGSGKTLIMAALMLDCYKRGYRDFVFFAPYDNIVEKTRANFCDSKSGKYLFASEIVIDGELVEIKTINNLFEASKNGAINIYFSTIHTLFNRLKFGGEKENSLSLQDLEGRKIVFLADEAHHLNVETKQKLNKSEMENKENWESVIKKGFGANDENLLFEFSATLPKYDEVLKKYKDKTVFEYALKAFHNDGFSKRIYLLKYNGLEIEERFLGSVILNIYRMLLARKEGFFLKPVILFKSRLKAESQANERLFNDFINKLDSMQIGDFLQSYARLSVSDDDENALFFEAREFFISQKISDEALCAMIKEFFNASSLLNVNDTASEEQRQILLNSLEAKDNKIRAIFAVDKLNEGWDVLNLFDIVRLNAGAIKDTTKEAQLIGRGARYYPFKLQGFEDEFKRKFDTQKTPLKALEILAYHAASENEFISRLNSELVNMGLKEPRQKRIILRVKEEIKRNDFYKEAYFATNSRYKIASAKSLFSDEVVRKITSNVNEITVPLFNAKGVEQENLLKDDYSTKTNEVSGKEIEFKDFTQSIIIKAMNILHKTYNFNALSKRFNIHSKSEFITKYLNFTLKLHPRQRLDFDNTALTNSIRLKIALFVLEKLSQSLNEYLDSYKVSSFKVKALGIIGDKEIMRDEEIQEYGGYEWFYFDKFVGNKLEKAFLDFIEANKNLIDKHFEKWLVIRNERFSELALYDDREFLANGAKNENYAKKFEPDFYFLGKKKEDKSLIMQGIFEPKGEHLATNNENKWKEEFLESLFNKEPISHKNMSVKLRGLPFFKDKDNEKFRLAFGEFLEQ